MICAAVLPTLPEFFERVYLPCRLVGGSADTVEQYRLALKHWDSVHPGKPISQIDSMAVAAFQQWLASGRSTASVNAYSRPIKALLRFAACEDQALLDRAPGVRMLPERRRAPLALTLSEFQAVLAAAEAARGTIAGYPAAAWWRAVLLTGWETGLRIKAVLRIRAIDLLWSDRGLFSTREDAKDREADWFPLQDATLDAIRAVFDPTRERMIPRGLADSTVSHRFRAILDASGIYAPKGACLAFHRIRRSKASYTEVAGGDAQRALGHSTRKVTERYLDPRIVGRAKQPPMPMPF